MSDLTTYILFGAYAYATGIFGFLWREIKTLRENHIKHIEERLDRLENEE